MRVRLADGYLLWFVVAHPYQPTLRLSPNPLDVPGIVCHRELSCLTPAQTGVDETVRFAGVARNPCLDELKSFRRLGAELIRSEIFKQDFTFGGFARINRAFRPRFNRDRLAPSFLWEYIKPHQRSRQGVLRSQRFRLRLAFGSMAGSGSNSMARSGDGRCRQRSVRSGRPPRLAQRR